MIFTSKRCFLNILIPMWPKERILNANYYIGDQSSSTNVGFDDFGQIVQEDGISNTMTKYHIKINRVLDPEPHVTHGAMMGISEYSSPEESFIKSHLDNPETYLAVYRFLFRDQLAGNGLQILMLNDDENTLRFGHIICQYLSKNFGVDIIYLDPIYRKNCRGQGKYIGDKEFGAKTIKDIRDYNLIFEFNQALTQSDISGTLSNLRMFLSSYDIEATFYLYNLLWPNDPLPPGNYTLDHLREIIISRTTEGRSERSESMFNNLLIEDWEGTLRRLQQENADFGSDDGVY